MDFEALLAAHQQDSGGGLSEPDALDRALDAPRGSSGGGGGGGGGHYHDNGNNNERQAGHRQGGGGRGRGGRGHGHHNDEHLPDAGTAVEEEPGTFKYVCVRGFYPRWDAEAWGLEEAAAAGSLVVQFEAQAPDNVVVALSPSADQVFPMYEIVVGGWKNSKSAIRRGAQDSERALRHQTLLCSPTEFRPFWAMQRDGVVSVGAGEAVGQNLILAWKDPDPVPAKFVSFTSWERTARYRNVRVRPCGPDDAALADDDDMEAGLDAFVPDYMAKLDAERAVRRRRAERFDAPYVEPSAEALALEVLTPAEQELMRADRRDPRGPGAGASAGFATGFDPTTEEEQAKRQARAERFKDELAGQAEAEAEAAAARGALEARARRFDTAVVPDLNAARAVVGDLSGLRVPRRDPEEGEQARPEALHLYGGFDSVQHKDLLGWFAKYGPSHAEWLHDCGANVVFADAGSARRALAGLGRPLPSAEDAALAAEVPELEEVLPALRAAGYVCAPMPMAHGHGPHGHGHADADAERYFLMRTAAVADVKADHASGYRSTRGYGRRGGRRRVRGGRANAGFAQRESAADVVESITGNKRGRRDDDSDGGDGDGGGGAGAGAGGEKEDGDEKMEKRARTGDVDDDAAAEAAVGETSVGETAVGDTLEEQ